MKKMLLGGALVMGLMLGLRQVVLAESTIAPRVEKPALRKAQLEERRAQVEEKKEVRKEKIEAVRVQVGEKAEKVAEKCTDVEKRIDQQRVDFTNTHAMHKLQFEKMQKSLKEVTTKLKAAGRDVSMLEAKAVVLTQKINTFNTDHAAFIAQLKLARQYSCGKSEGVFKTEMAKARELLKQVQKDSREVKTYYQTEIRPVLASLRTVKQ